MSLLGDLTQDIKASMKAKDSATLSTLRLLLSALKNKKIDVQHELSDAEVQEVIKSQVKQLRDSLIFFEQGGRSDMVESAKTEITVLQKYLPAQMSDEELKALVEKSIAETGVTSKADMGKVMGAAVKASQGRADGSRVKDLVMQLLPLLFMVIVGSFYVTRPAVAAIPLSASDFGIDATFIELGLRLFRVLILWLGIPAITLIIAGAFKCSVEGVRDDIRRDALGKITKGVFVSIMVILIFSLSTVALARL